MSWTDNIPKQGVLCKTSSGNLVNVVGKYPNGNVSSKCGAMFPVDWLTPLTPQEWWEFAPWNYDMDSAPKDGDHILLKNIRRVGVGYFYSEYWRSIDNSCFTNPIAWLPLPEQSK